MRSRFQGTSLPQNQATGPEQFVRKVLSTSDDASIEQGCATTRTRVRRGSLTAWIERHDPVPATVPVVSRRRWIRLVTEWAATDAGKAALAAHSMRLTLFLAVMAALAQHCNGSTGRNIAVGNKRVGEEAGCSPRSVTTARTILLSAGWLHRSLLGCPSSSGRFNRPAVDHLTTPRPVGAQPATAATAQQQAQPVHQHVDEPAPEASSTTAENRPVCAVLRSTPVGHLSTVKNGAWKPKARPGALRNTASLKPIEERRRWYRAYAIADELISRTVGLDGARGAVAAALNFSPLNLETWTAAKIKSALDIWGKSHLDAAGQRRQMDWPSEIARPGAFLAYRLQHLDVNPEKPVQRYIAPPAAPATGSGRRSAWAAIKAELTQLNHTRADRYLMRERAVELNSCPVCGSGRFDRGICQRCQPIAEPDMPTPGASRTPSTSSPTITLGRISA